jgi:DNA-binding beta-propeller fold protein YncE
VTGADSLYDDVLDIQAFREPEVIADIGFNYENTEPVSIAYSSGNLYVTDKAKGNVYSMATSLNSEIKVFASGMQSPYLIDNDADGNLVVVDGTESSVISTISRESGSIKRHAGLSLSKIGVLNGIDVWTENGYLYSISQAKQSVLKQAGIAGNYQLPNDSAPWYKNESVAQAKDIAVDGNIYLLIEGVGLKRYLTGSEAALTFVGLTPTDTESLKNADAFEKVGAKTYLADSDNRRVLVFQNVNNGAELILRFERQIVYRGDGNIFENIKEMVKNPAADELYVLDGTKVIRIQGV